MLLSSEARHFVTALLITVLITALLSDMNDGSSVAGIYHLLFNVSFSTFPSFTRWTYCYSPAEFIPGCREHERGVVVLMAVDDSCLRAQRKPALAYQGHLSLL